MTGTTITEEQFAAFVREHRGDYAGEAAAIVAEFVEQIGGDRAQLFQLLYQQAPAYELVSNHAMEAPDGCSALPAAFGRVTQVVPAHGAWRIGHMVETRRGWLPYHYTLPNQQIGLAVPSQLTAVIRVFVEHFATMGASR